MLSVNSRRGGWGLLGEAETEPEGQTTRPETANRSLGTRHSPWYNVMRREGEQESARLKMGKQKESKAGQIE